MKLASLMTLGLIANLSFAAPMFCKGTNGYTLSVSDNLKKATIKKDGQPVQFGQLNCMALVPPCVPSHGNAIECSPILNCNTAEHVADAGFNASIRLTPRTQLMGKISKQSFVGPIEVSQLKCVAALN